MPVCQPLSSPLFLVNQDAPLTENVDKVSTASTVRVEFADTSLEVANNASSTSTAEGTTCIAVAEIAAFKEEVVVE